MTIQTVYIRIPLKIKEYWAFWASKHYSVLYELKLKKYYKLIKVINKEILRSNFNELAILTLKIKSGSNSIISQPVPIQPSCPFPPNQYRSGYETFVCFSHTVCLSTLCYTHLFS